MGAGLGTCYFTLNPGLDGNGNTCKKHKWCLGSGRTIFLQRHRPYLSNKQRPFCFCSKKWQRNFGQKRKNTPINIRDIVKSSYSNIEETQHL